MKTLLLTIVLSLFCACAFPQKITGKWDSDKDVVKALLADFEDISCSYKFKKNGTFIIKIDGETTIHHSTTILWKKIGTIQIKGHYAMYNGQISSFVNEDGIEIDALEIYQEKGMFESEDHYHLATSANSYYDSRDYYAKEMKSKLLHKLMEHRYLWDWNKEPITITKKELIIGDKLRCKR